MKPDLYYTPSFKRALDTLGAAGSIPVGTGRYRSRRQARMLRYRPMSPIQAGQNLAVVGAATDRYSINCVADNGDIHICVDDEVLFVDLEQRFERGTRNMPGGRVMSYLIRTGTVTRIVPGGLGNTPRNHITIQMGDGQSVERASFPNGIWRKAWRNEVCRDGVLAVIQIAAEKNWNQHQFMNGR